MSILNYINPIKFARNREKVLFILVILYLCIGSVSNSIAQLKQNGYNYQEIVLERLDSKDRLDLEDSYYLLSLNSDVSFKPFIRQKFTLIKQLNNGLSVVRIKDQLSTHDKNDILNSYSLYRVNNLWKLNTTLFENYQDLTNESESVVFMIKLLEGNELLPSYIQSAKKISKEIYRVKLNSKDLTLLINEDNIIYIGYESIELRSESIVIDLNLNPNRINAVQAYYKSLNGQDQLISIQEPQYNIEDIDLAGRYNELPYTSAFSDNHATEMATIIAGSGNSFITGLGVAPKVRHTSADNVDIVPQENIYYRENNIYVQNHSYGTAIESFYGSLAEAYDQSSYENPNLLHVQSAGNAGLDSAGSGIYAGIEAYANLTGNFKQAKSVLTIGSVDTTGQHILFSSTGPAFDGRIKPELVTYGMVGTSNSAALVSGVAVLLQQRYQQRFNIPANASLLKAILINSADEADVAGPDHRTGYGQLNALSAIKTIDSMNFIQDTISISADSLFFEVDLPTNAKNFKITLVWTDIPAPAGSEKALINDLDLQVISEQGEITLPYVLNHYPLTDSLELLAIRGVDHINTNEQVYIKTPNPGKYQIQVSASSLSTERQVFSIAYQYDISNNFEWTSPTFNDNLPYNGETTSHLRWESSYENLNGELSYRVLDEPSDWKTINSTVNLSNEQFRWEAPDTYSLAQLKMLIDGTEYLSDTFTISRPLRLQLNFDCTDSLLMSWDKIENADNYLIKNLNNNQLDSLDLVSDTFKIFYKNELNTNFISISPLKNDKELIRSFTIDYSLQGGFCYLNSYFAYVEQDSGVFIEAKLGTFLGVDRLFLQKFINGEWKDYLSETVDQTDFKLLDRSPDNGDNLYRIKLSFENGQEVISDVLEAFFVKDKQFIVYPNPIGVDEELKVFGKSVKQFYSFELLTLNGEVVLSYIFDNDRAFIELPPNLGEGLYLYNIYSNDNSVYHGKLLVKNY